MTASFELGNLVVDGVMALVGFLLLRSINAIDGKLERLELKVDSLHTRDAELGRELAELRVRVTHLEEKLRV